MALEEYKKKRHFNKTPEPEGEKSKDGAKLRFVVQKHEASRLHYDFRLELDGVMKSWAVPKGPSTDPSVKHLAMMVEDHPLNYRTFEGVIPEGNYGAGTVMVWDEGWYESEPTEGGERALREGLEKGDLKFGLHGTKLNGSWVLAQMKGAWNTGKEWLLIKHRDEFASKKDVTKEDKSAETGRSMEEIRGEVGSEK